MEIQYERFNKRKLQGRNFKFIDGETELLTSEDIKSFLNGIKPDLTKDKEDQYLKLIDRVECSFDAFMDYNLFRDEIELNISNISSKDQVLRYLNYLKKENDFTISHLKMMLYHYEFLESKIDVNDRFAEGNTLSLLHTDIISKLIRSFIGIINWYIEDSKFIDEKLNPELKEQPIILENELTAVNHRLVLLYKLGIFKTLYQQNYNLIGKNGFVKLIASIIDVPKDPKKDPKKQLEGFRIEVSKLIDEMNNPSVKKSVLNDTAVSKVNMLLAEIGLLN